MTLRGRARQLLSHPAIPLLVVGLSFVASRVLYRAVLGARFDPSALAFFIQYAPVALLRDDLASTLWHLHHQAPLPNLLAGLALQVPSGLAWLDGLHVALGLSGALALCVALRRLGAGALLATLAASAFAASPITALYELWLFYHHLVAVLLLFAVLALLSYLRAPSTRRAAVFFGVLALVAFTRSIYGVVWMGAAAVILLVVDPRRARQVLLAAAAPVALVLALGLKTRVQTGESFGDAMLWPNLATKVVWALPHFERRQLIQAGLLHRVHNLEPFSRLEAFENLGADVSRPPTGVRLFDERQVDGQWNKHHLGYLELARRYYRPATATLYRRYPATYLGAFADSLWVQSMRPASEDIYLGATPNRARLRLVEVAQVLALGGLTERGQLRAMLVVAPATVAYGLFSLLRRRALAPSQRARRAVIAFAVMTIGYVTLGTTLVSYADHSRYRFEVDALYVLVVACALAEAAGWLRGALARRTARRP